MTGAAAGVARPRLVALRALGLGDLLTTVPALRALADAFPSHHLVLATAPALEPLVRLTGTGFEVVPAAPLAPLPAELAAPDVAVNLHGSGPESHRVLLALRPSRLVAHAHPGVPESAAGPPWDPAEHEVARWCRLLEAHGISADPGRLELARPAAGVPDGVAGATVVHPGAADGARRWPAERWAEVARHEADRGRRVVVTGGPAEVDLARTVADRAGLDRRCVLAGSTDVEGLAAVVAAAGKVACGDTGVAHLATAYGTPSVLLFGPVPPALWGPPRERPQHVALWRGGRGDPHACTPDPGLLAITVEEVVAALDRLAPAPAGSPATPAVSRRR